METFQALGLAEPILQAITETGYENPTPIQLQAIPAVLAGSDVLGIAQTGTGKTAAFALPILHQLAANRKPAPRRGVRALILSPTRELASQIADSFRTYGKHLGFTVGVVFGGVSERPQSDKLNRGLDILVATPGRLLDHMGQRNVSLQSTEIFVLDEADQMLDLGFFKPIRRIVADLPKARQSLFFSATMPKEIEELTRELLTDPVKVAVAPQSTTVERVSQRVIRIEQSKKKALLAELLGDEAMQRTLVFTRTKRGADRVAKHLSGARINSAAIHGNKSQAQREAALHAFKTGHTRVLVATDIAARGIDIDEVSHVVNYELPEVPEAYVHRIGRTARAGASGSAISFCDEGERHLLRDIERVTRQAIESLDRRNDATLVADKPAGKGSQAATGEPRDGERPSEARREFKRQSDRGFGRGGDRGGRSDRGGERSARPDRGPRPERADRPDRGPRPERSDSERKFTPRGDRPYGDRPRGDREGGERRFERREGGAPRGDRPRREREGGDAVWTSDGSRPNREHRSEHRGDRRPSEDGRPPFRQGDRGSRPEGRREDRPWQARGERSSGDGERRPPRSFDGPRGDRPQGAPRGDRPWQSRGGDRPRQDGERRSGGGDWKPRHESRDGARPEHRGPRPEGSRPEGRRPEGGRPGGERSGGWRSDNNGPRRERSGEPRREGRPQGDRDGGKPRHHGGGGERSFGGNGGLKRPSGPHREGGKPEFRKPAGERGAWRGRDDKRPPRRDAEGA